MSYRRPLGLYPLFQIPAILLSICLVLALLFWLLGLGRPEVSVAIAVDLSSSTYEPGLFNAQGTVMAEEIKAIEAYLVKNHTSRRPNQVQIFGFADTTQALTPSFGKNPQEISQALTQSLKPSLAQTIGTGTNLDLAIQEGIRALATRPHCRELLIVTDGAVSVNPQVIAEARENNVRINAVVIGTNAPEIQSATLETGGKYLSSSVSQLDTLFTRELFEDFNNNWRWILLWLGLGWICFMWLLTMPLDRWLFQKFLKMPMNQAGQFALGNALFWTVLTPIILWQLYSLFDLVLPFFGQC